jgi:hypothetical protein
MMHIRSSRLFSLALLFMWYPLCAGCGAPSGSEAEVQAAQKCNPKIPETCGGDCTPDCTDQECGPNGCGGSCGTCASGSSCKAGHCVCTPHCSGKQCGSDGCGGTCGTCGAGTVCSGNQCVCAPQCSGKQCGSDGCGGSCGSCGANETCSANLCIVNQPQGGGGGTNGTLIMLPLCQEWQEQGSGSAVVSTEMQSWEMFPDPASTYPRGAACNWSPGCQGSYYMSPRDGSSSRILDWAQQVTAYGVVEELCPCGARATCPEVPTNSRTLWMRPLSAAAAGHPAVLQINGEVYNVGDSLVRGEVTYSARLNDGREKCLSAPAVVIEVLKDNAWVDVASTAMTCCNTTRWANDCATRFDTAVVQALVPANSLVRLEVRWSEAQNPSYPDDLILSDALLFGAQCFANPDPHGSMCQ